MFGYNREGFTAPAAGNPRGMSVWVDFEPPHQTVRRVQLTRRHRLRNPSGGQDLLTVPDASAKIELTELDHVCWPQSEHAAGCVQVHRIGSPVESSRPLVSGV